LNNGDFYETHVAYRLALIHSISVHTDNLSSKLLTKTHQMHHPASRTPFSDTITSWIKTAVVVKLSKVIFAEYFTYRQNLMLISLPKD